MIRRVEFVLASLLLAAIAAVPVRAAAEDTLRPSDDPELRERMQAYFATRLRADLGLDDAEAAIVLPRIEAVERARTEARRERVRLLATMRRLLRAGASDVQIRTAVERLDAAQLAQADRLRGLVRDVDAVLTPRQQAELRLFLDRFRHEMASRVESLRGRR